MKFKKNAKDLDVCTSDFWYDFFDGGYIVPEELMSDEDEIDAVNIAARVLKKFYNELIDKEIITLI